MTKRRRKARVATDVAAPVVARRNAPWRDVREVAGPDGVVATLYLGDCREVMAALEQASVHSIATDPPYEIGFMGKDWDRAGGVASDPATWAVALHALTPGGHMAASAGSRTYHRIAMAIERAGFEIRDQLMWIYGSGFPKSRDISKLIDAADAKSEAPEDVLRFTSWLRQTGITAKQINAATGTSMASHYLSAGSQPAVPTSDHFDKIRPLLPKKVPAWVERMVDDRSVRARVKSENMARRQVVGKHADPAPASRWRETYSGDAAAPSSNITIPYTDEAKRWEGWGTALKPAHEPIALARKTVGGTVAGCVMAHGTGALNIDACRIGDEAVATMEHFDTGATQGYSGGLMGGKTLPPEHWNTGRWPANVITDGTPEILEAFPSSAREAIKFFYGAKASTAEREFGLSDAGRRSGAQIKGRKEGSAGTSTAHSGISNTRRANVHPTVKPVALMAWLCRLITPPGGVVLDPFLGSGSTGIATVRHGFRFIGIEQSEEYFEIACKRIEAAARAEMEMPTLERQIARAARAVQLSLLDG